MNYQCPSPKLVVKAKRNVRTRNRIVVANLPLVWKIANRYARHHDVDDLVQEGVIGLMRAIKSYDPEKGAAFGTWAGYWVLAYVNHAFRKTQPVGGLKNRSRASVAKQLAHCTDPARREMLQRRIAALGPVSRLDGPVRDGITLAEIIPGNSRSPDSQAAENELVREFRQGVNALPEQLRTIMEWRLSGRTLADVGAALRLHARVGQATRIPGHGGTHRQPQAGRGGGVMDPFAEALTVIAVVLTFVLLALFGLVVLAKKGRES